MPVQINEVIIRAIITNDDKKSAAGPHHEAGKAKEGDGEKLELLELIEEAIKNKKER